MKVTFLVSHIQIVQNVYAVRSLKFENWPYGTVIHRVIALCLVRYGMKVAETMFYEQYSQISTRSLCLQDLTQFGNRPKLTSKVRVIFHYRIRKV